MSEPVQLAKTAREHLAAALRALQGSGDVPQALEDLAEPIAAAMGVLHRVERSGGADLDGRDTALTNVRSALDRLQALDGTHPAVETVMEEVAQSLGKVHALVKYVAPAPAPVVAQPIPTGTVRMDVPVAPMAPAQPAYVAPQPAPQPAYVAPQPAPQPAYVAPQQPAYVAPQQPAQPAYAAPAPQPAYVAPQPAPQPAYAAPAPQPAYAPPQPAPQAYAVPQPTPQPVAPVRAAPEPPKGSTGVIDVELGTHSPSNFYKGLGGNDVIEHGGIFVSTYKVQKIGTNVALRILLPGDYEFQANAVVQWIRAQSGSDEPGFGARFTHITPEGRQLVYRYTRNREPMFYDDL